MIPAELAQRALFAVTDARSCGVSPIALQQAVADRTVVRLKRGWYTAQPLPHPADRHRLRVEAELLDHPGTIPSHHSPPSPSATPCIARIGHGFT